MRLNLFHIFQSQFFHYTKILPHGCIGVVGVICLSLHLSPPLSLPTVLKLESWDFPQTPHLNCNKTEGIFETLVRGLNYRVLGVAQSTMSKSPFLCVWYPLKTEFDIGYFFIRAAYLSPIRQGFVDSSSTSLRLLKSKGQRFLTNKITQHKLLSSAKLVGVNFCDPL